MLVSFLAPLGNHIKIDVVIGSGCIAALEAEKFLAEQEDAAGLENEKDAKKGEDNAEAPEYRSNPLL